MLNGSTIALDQTGTRLCEVCFWPIATNFLLGPDVSFRGEAEMGREANPANSVENDPKATSARDRRTLTSTIKSAGDDGGFRNNP